MTGCTLLPSPCAKTSCTHMPSPKVLKTFFALAVTLGWSLRANLMQCFQDVCCCTAACQGNMLCLTQEISQPQRRQPPRRKAQQQFSLDSDSSDDYSPAEQEELSREEEAVPPEPIRRPRSARVNRTTLLSMDFASLRVFVDLTGMHKTVCLGETRLVLHIPSSSRAGKALASLTQLYSNILEPSVAPIVLASSVCQDVAPPKHLSSLICNSTLVQILGSAAPAVVRYRVLCGRRASPSGSLSIIA